ncbi:ABC transporter permease [Rathayibacter sp. VKM Ac-2754]|uniref:ABC transporter permease n=1 Tax=Rathayibacter sp. VKM Ac-2754 TaxID=2609251 RepID=UPI00135C5D4C|nr:ABC transporter permease [Rathayibacter sp. VKM Ac-2754]MWV60768.1 ABC transporter permease subunit [Rathayibacter sp. VKM Ac-2754]
MVAFLARRLIAAILLILSVSVVTFFLVYSSGADIARNILGQTATEESVRQRTEELGLNLPLWQQYADWLGGALTGDLGSSFYNNQPVTDALANRVPVTLSVVIGAVLVVALFSALLGVLAAVRRGWIDRAVQVFNVIANAIPNFWLALVLVIAFAITVPLFPATGYTRFEDDPGLWLLGLILPIVSLAFGGLSVASIVRSSMIDVLRQDYIRTLQSRGLSRREILYVHALRNAAAPWLTLLGLQFIGLIGGAVVIEKVFALPGLGSLTVSAALQGDVPIIMGVVLVVVVLVVLIYLLIDLANAWLNPKVRAR